MNLPGREEFATPVDDPCQFNPDWRSIVAGYLVEVGVNTAEKLKSVAMTGCIEVLEGEKPDEESDGEASGEGAGDGRGEGGEAEGKTEDGAEKKPKKGKKKAKKGAKDKDVRKKTLVPVVPFHDNPGYRLFANDKWIVEQVLFCGAMGETNVVPGRFIPLKLAERWYTEKDCEAAIKHRIEALLLTEATLDVIVMDLIGQLSVRPAVEAYEKLYFNCRDEHFEISPSMHLVTRMAMPFGPLKMYLKKWERINQKDGRCINDGRPLAKDSDVWKAIGATMGYDTLIYVWNWERRASGIKDKSLRHKIECTWHSAVSNVMTALFTGDMKHEDAARMLATCTAQLKFLDDSTSGNAGSGANDLSRAMMGMLYRLAPKMVTIDSDESERNEEIESRIQSQLAIEKQEINDKGSHVDEEVMESQISHAIEQ